MKHKKTKQNTKVTVSLPLDLLFKLEAHVGATLPYADKFDRIVREWMFFNFTSLDYTRASFRPDGDYWGRNGTLDDIENDVPGMFELDTDEDSLPDSFEAMWDGDVDPYDLNEDGYSALDVYLSLSTYMPMNLGERLHSKTISQSTTLRQTQSSSTQSISTQSSLQTSITTKTITIQTLAEQFQTLPSSTSSLSTTSKTNIVNNKSDSLSLPIILVIIFGILLCVGFVVCLVLFVMKKREHVDEDNDSQISLDNVVQHQPPSSSNDYGELPKNVVNDVYNIGDFEEV